MIQSVALWALNEWITYPEWAWNVVQCKLKRAGFLVYTYVALRLCDSLARLLTHGVSSGVLAQLSLGLSIGPLTGLLGQTRWHCGSCDNSLEATLPLLYVELRVEDNDVHLGHVEHAQCYWGTEVHGDGQGRCLNVQLKGSTDRWKVILMQTE